MQKPTFSHHVFFWLNNPDSTSDRDALLAGVKKLAAISQIRSLQIGLPAPSERAVVDSSWSVSLLLFFDDAAGEAAYQAHPVHLEFIEKCRHLWQRVLIYDAFSADGGN